MFPNTLLFIDGRWRPGAGGRTLDVLNPVTNDVIGTVACAEQADLEEAAAAARKGFKTWRAVSAHERSRVLRKAADLLRARSETIAAILTQEQGKPLAEARLEIGLSADVLDWCAEEGRRAYGRVIPARAGGIHQLVVQEPVGPVAAFTPWNFPVSQVVRKLGAALAAGCSIIIKAAEDTPASGAELVRILAEAGVPDGALALVYGDPAAISGFLVPHPAIRKVSFTGSVPVGKQLAALAGQHMKRATMELGGHSPAIVFDDVDVDAVSTILVTSKFRNAGQVCVSPTRFLVQETIYDRFVDAFTQKAAALKVGDGLDPDSKMGPLITQRRLQAVEALIADATRDGARLATGGGRIGNKGNFLQPTVLRDVEPSMRVMNEEPFGPLALMRPFSTLDEVVDESNRLPYGLAAYAFSRSAKHVAALSEQVETGMLTVNHLGLGIPETPFGGVKDSGYGSEGGTEVLEAYLATKFVTHATQV